MAWLGRLVVVIVFLHLCIEQTESTGEVDLTEETSTTFTCSATCEDSGPFPANTSAQCPTWFVLEDKRNGSKVCECGSDLNGAVLCWQDLCRVSILNCRCMTYTEDTRETVVGRCPYSCYNETKTPLENVYRPIPQNVTELNSAVCGNFHRDGQLCGKCEQGYIPPLYVYSRKCVKCTYSPFEWPKYIFFSFVPVTIFFFIVICCRINIFTGPMIAFVHISQVMGAPFNVRALMGAAETNPDSTVHLTTVRIIGALYGIWNLDFLRTVITPICIHMTTLEILAIEYVTAFYPFVLIVATYILIEVHARNFQPVVLAWKPFHKCFARFRIQWNIQSSLVGALATFLLLSYTRLLNVSFDLLIPTEVFSINGTKKHPLFLYFDGTVEYFGKEHTLYATGAIIVFLIFNVLPLIFLLLYPLKCCNRCLQKYSPRQFHAIRAFAEAFQGCYKDGTCGTRDCRYFAVFYFVMRLLLFALYAVTRSTMLYPLALVLLLGIAASVVIIQPYKVALYNILDTLLILAASVYCGLAAGIILANAKDPQLLEVMSLTSLIAALIPLMYATGAVLYWLLACKKFPQKLKAKIKAWKQRKWNVNLSAVDESLPDRIISPDRYIALEEVMGADGGSY